MTKETKPILISPQKAMQITSSNSMTIVNSSRKLLIQQLAELISQRILDNAELGFQHTFLNFSDYKLQQLFEHPHTQHQDTLRLIRIAVEYLNSQTALSNWIFQLVPSANTTDGINDANGIYLVWGKLNANGVIEHGTDLDYSRR